MEQETTSMIPMIIFLVVIFAAMYFLMGKQGAQQIVEKKSGPLM